MPKDRGSALLLQSAETAIAKANDLMTLVEQHRKDAQSASTLDRLRVKQIHQLESLLAHERKKNLLLLENCETLLHQNRILHEKISDCYAEITRSNAHRKRLETQVSAQTKKIRATGKTTPSPPTINSLFSKNGPLGKGSIARNSVNPPKIWRF